MQMRSLKQKQMCSGLAGKRWLRVPCSSRRSGFRKRREAAGPSVAAALELVSDLFGELELHQCCTNKGIRKRTVSPGSQSCSVRV